MCRPVGPRGELYLDSHGHLIVAPVWQLLERACRHFGVFPTVVERDANIPPLPELRAELATISEIQHRVQAPVSPEARSLEQPHGPATPDEDRAGQPPPGHRRCYPTDPAP